MKTNAFCIGSPNSALKTCEHVFAVVGSAQKNDKITRVYEYGRDTGGDVMYLPSMLDEDLFESFCDEIVCGSIKAFVRASYDLNEAGLIEARYKLSPIMLLHKLGVLEYCTIVGGVCLDNDDLDLMAQEGVPLVILPTADAGYGYGYAPVCAALRRGIRVGVGTFDGKYNPAHDLNKEIEFLKITANAEMRTENAVSIDKLKQIAEFV